LLKIENALLLDILLGYPFGRIWFSNVANEDSPGREHPDTFLLKGEQLTAIKELVRKGNALASRVAEGLRSRADVLLYIQNPSVTQKKKVPAGASLHDYCSLAKYWWPNPDTVDGMPYVRRDGYINPNVYTENYDLNRLETFSDACLLLAVAAYITDDKIYAEKARSLIKTWLLDDETKQNPNFQYAQIIPGNTKVRAAGLVESRRFIYVCEALQILKFMKLIPDEEFDQCKRWFREFLEWLETSPQGIKASQAQNNIGLWYDLQRLVFAKFTNQEERKICEIISHSIIPKMKEQTDAVGKLQNEMSRARPYDYVAFTLLAMAGLIAASDHGEIRLAQYSTEESESFANALNWFNETIGSNDLQEKALALAQLSFQRQLIAEFRLQNATNSKLIRNQENDPASLNSMERIIERLQFKEREVLALTSELTEAKSSLLELSLYYKGIDFVVNQLHEKLKNVQERYNQLEKDASDLHEQLVKATEEIDLLKRKVLDLEQQKDRMGSQETSLNSLVDYLLLDLQKKRKQNDESKKELAKRKDELHQLNQQRQQLLKKRNQIKKEYTLLRNSRSWRYTSGLRKAANHIRKWLKVR